MTQARRARSGRKAAKSGGVAGGAADGWFRWIVGVGALGLAIIAVHLLMTGGGDHTKPASPRGSAKQPALDDIDAASREAMRDLLREAGD